MTAAEQITVRWHRPLAPAVVLRTAGKYIARYGWHCPPGLYGPAARDPRRPEFLPASMLGAVRAAVYGIPKWYPETVALEVREQVLAGYAAATEHLVVFLATNGHAELATDVWLWERNPTRSPRDVLGALHAAAACASGREPDLNALGGGEGRLAQVLTLPVRPARPTTAVSAGDAGAALFHLTDHTRRVRPARQR